jgi:hypothetical protein
MQSQVIEPGVFTEVGGKESGGKGGKAGRKGGRQAGREKIKCGELYSCHTQTGILFSNTNE